MTTTTATRDDNQGNDGHQQTQSYRQRIPTAIHTEYLIDSNDNGSDWEQTPMSEGSSNSMGGKTEGGAQGTKMIFEGNAGRSIQPLSHQPDNYRDVKKSVSAAMFQKPQSAFTFSSPEPRSFREATPRTVGMTPSPMAMMENTPRGLMVSASPHVEMQLQSHTPSPRRTRAASTPEWSVDSPQFNLPRSTSLERPSCLDPVAWTLSNHDTEDVDSEYERDSSSSSSMFSDNLTMVHGEAVLRDLARPVPQRASSGSSVRLLRGECE